MREVEIIKTKKVRDLIASNLEVFYKLDLAGVNNISTAIDYLSICDEYDKYNWIESALERKKVVALKYKVTVRTVENALCLMSRDLQLKD